MPIEISLPEIPGDPAGMRALAGALRGDAQAVEGVGSGIVSTVGSMSFEGPAADRLLERAQSSRRSLGDCAVRLQDLASMLDTKAAEVEQAQRDRLARLEQMRAELLEQGIPARVA